MLNWIIFLNIVSVDATTANDHKVIDFLKTHNLFDD